MKLLQRVHEAMQGPAASGTCLEQFRSTGKMSRESAEEFASGTLASLQELLVSEHGIKTSSVTDAEIARFVKDANTKDAGSFSAVEYQDLMNKLVKYAALKARRSPRKRLTLGVSVSAAAAAAVAASAMLPVAAAASAGVMVAAAPVGAAVGAIAVTIDSRRQPARDRKRATRHTPRKPAVEAAPAAEITAAEEPTAAVADTAEAAPPTPQPAAALEPAGEAAADSTTPLSSTGGSEELVSAVVEVMPPADAAASPFSKESLAAAGLPVTAAAALDGDADMAGLPELVQSASPEKHAAEAADCISPQLSSARVSMDVPMFDDHVGSIGAQLPPLAKKKSTGTKAIKKSLSKSYKSVKKAFSLNSSSSLDAAAAAAVQRADGSITAPTGKPPKSSFLRRSFSHDSSSLSDKDSGLIVQPSEGSATLRKMKEAFRRSFDLKRSSSSNRISMDSALGTA